MVFASSKMLSLNLFWYCNNSPMMYSDFNGFSPSEDAFLVVQKYATPIKQAAKIFGIDAATLGAIIYVEHFWNYNFIDKYIDWNAAYFIDASLGVCQVKISTAVKVEDAGYMPATYNLSGRTDGMDLKRRRGIIDKLSNDYINIKYAAAYLAWIIDLWKYEYRYIANDVGVLATLYNGGEQGSHGIHSNPKASNFGLCAKSVYNKIYNILNRGGEQSKTNSDLRC